jgi:hypothetical protein
MARWGQRNGYRLDEAEPYIGMRRPKPNSPNLRIRKRLGSSKRPRPTEPLTTESVLSTRSIAETKRTHWDFVAKLTVVPDGKAEIAGDRA